MEQQATEMVWTSFNHHRMSGKHTTEGYAYCDNCGVAEDQKAWGEPCRKGPVRKFHEDELHHMIDEDSLIEEGLSEYQTGAQTLAIAIKELGESIRFGATEIAIAVRDHG